MAAAVIPNTVPINPNRIGGSFSTYPDDPNPFQKRNLSPQPPTNRTNQFVPSSTPSGGGGGG
jgi:hypothetical protein